MANEIEKVNTIAIADIEKIMGKTDDNIEKLSGFEFTGVTFPAWAGTRGVVAGGTQTAHADLDVIQYKTVGTTANTVDFGDLQTSRSQHMCAGSNQTIGIWGSGMGRPGGTQTYGVTDTDYITIASTGNGTDFADVDQAGAYGIKNGCSNGTLLFSVGGYEGTAGNLDRMEYFTIASASAGTDAGNLSSVKLTMAGTNGDSRYIIIGGFDGSAAVNEIEYNDFSTSANVSDFGNLTGTSLDCSSANSTVRAVFVVPSASGGDNTMEYVTVASTGNSINFGDLATGRDSVAGTSDGTTGEFSGGNDGSTTDEIDIITIASTGNGTDVGNLIQGNEDPGATSGS